MRDRLKSVINHKIPNIYSAFIILFIAGLITVYIIVHWFPEYARYLTKENSLLENLGTGLFFLCGIFAMIAAVLVKDKRYVPIAFSSTGFLFFLDEISWGRDIIWRKPYKIMGVEIDAAHDFVDVFLNLVAVYYRNWFFLFIVLFFLLILIYIMVKWRIILAGFFSGERRFFLGMIALFFYSQLLLMWALLTSQESLI